MSDPGSLVLRIFGEGRIDVDEAAILLAAVVNRPTERVYRAGCPAEPVTHREFLPVTLSTAWSGATREII